MTVRWHIGCTLGQITPLSFGEQNRPCRLLVVTREEELVKRDWNRTVRGLALPLAFSLTLGLLPREGAAEGRKTISEAALAEVARIDAAKATTSPAQAPSPTTPPTQESGHRSFFTTPKGIGATLLFAGLVGYTIHSRIVGAVHSPAR
jgi:hypothetical protein